MISRGACVRAALLLGRRLLIERAAQSVSQLEQRTEGCICADQGSPALPVVGIESIGWAKQAS